MKLVERHIIRSNHRFYPEIDRLCWLSKNLYNSANYLIRQSFIFEGIYLPYNDIQKAVQSGECDRGLNAKVCQQILINLDRSWRSFLEAKRAVQEQPEKFKGRLKLPKYKKKESGRNLLVYTVQAIGKRQLKQGIIHPSKTSTAL